MTSERFSAQRKLNETKILPQFIMLNSKRRLFTVHQIVHNFTSLKQEERAVAVVSTVEQFVGATEDLLMAYWTLRLLRDDPTLTPLEAYLKVDVKEGKESPFSSRNMMAHVSRCTRESLIKKLGLPSRERIRLLSASITVALLIHDLRKRYSLFDLEQYEPGEVIFREGDLADRVYFIQKGTVEVVRTLEGKEIVLARLGPGDFFGEMAFFVSNGRRTAAVRTSTPVELQVLGKENFTRLMQAIPAARKEFSAKAIERLRERDR